jgi:hypothetical protein
VEGGPFLRPRVGFWGFFSNCVLGAVLITLVSVAKYLVKWPQYKACLLLACPKQAREESLDFSE